MYMFLKIVIITPSFQFCRRQNFLYQRFNEAGDMLAACYLPQPPLTEVGDIFCRVIVRISHTRKSTPISRCTPKTKLNHIPICLDLCRLWRMLTQHQLHPYHIVPAPVFAATAFKAAHQTVPEMCVKIHAVIREIRVIPPGALRCRHTYSVRPAF